MTTSIDINDLDIRLVTRRNGEKAYNILKIHLVSGDVDLLIEDVNTMSMSFLDGLIAKLIAADELTKVTFVTDDHSLREKLSRIAEIRDAKFYYRVKNESKRRVVPQITANSHKPILVANKEES